MSLEGMKAGSSYRELLMQGTAYLQQCGVPDASYDAWALWEMVSGMSRSRYFMDQRLLCEKQEQVDSYIEALRKRASRIPLQHILGKAPFMRYEFYVNEHVLTPRADTEVLVEESFSLMKEMETGSVSLLDMCTGSGCIAISLYLMAKEAGMELSAVAVDLSEEALAVAERNNDNLADHQVKCIHSDMFQQLPEDMRFDIIVSNPPYIPSREIDGLMPEVKEHEPHMALDGLEDGLHYYRILARESRHWLKPGGCLALEIGYDQGESVPALLRANGFRQVQLVKDLAGLDRVVTGLL